MAKIRRIADGSQGEQINPKLLQLASNIVFPRDVRTKPNFWKAEVILYRDWQAIKGWTRDFSFLPHPDDWKEIKDQVIKELEVSQTTNCFFLRSSNNVITFIMQPLNHKAKGKARKDSYLGIDFFRPDVVLFFKGGNENTWKEQARMYRIIGVEEIDSRKLTLLITAKKDYCWQYYLNVLGSPAQVRVIRSQLNRYDSSGNEFSDVCFSFCEDLRRTKYFQSVQKGSGEARNNPGKAVADEWQPSFRILVSTIDTEFEALMKRHEEREESFSSATPPGMHNENCPASKDTGACEENAKCPKIPVFINLTEINPKHFQKALTTSDDIHFFVFPGKLEQKEAEGKKFWPTYYQDDEGRDGKAVAANYSNAFQSWLPEPFNEQPHLIASEHSSVQFYFMRKVIHTAKLNQCRVTYETSETNIDDPLRRGVRPGEESGEGEGSSQGSRPFKTSILLKDQGNNSAYFKLVSENFPSSLGSETGWNGNYNEKISDTSDYLIVDERKGKRFFINQLLEAKSLEEAKSQLKYLTEKDEKGKLKLRVAQKGSLESPDHCWDIGVQRAINILADSITKWRDKQWFASKWEINVNSGETLSREKEPRGPLSLNNPPPPNFRNLYGIPTPTGTTPTPRAEDVLSINNGEFDNASGLRIKGKKFGDPYGKAKHVLQYKVKTRASMAGICYHFETGSQLFRIELEISGFVSGKDAIMITLAKLRSGVENTFQELVPAGTDNMSLTGMGQLAMKLFTAAIPGIIAKYIQGVKVDPESFKDKFGLKKKTSTTTTTTTEVGSATRAQNSGGSKVDSPTPTVKTVEKVTTNKPQENYEANLSSAKKQVLASAAWGTLGKSCDKALSFVNTISMDYNMAELYNRSMHDPFEIRYEMSEQLYDNLYNNNNAPVAQTIDSRIECLNNLIMDHGAQEIQAEVKLLYDGEIGAEFENAFANGTIIYRRNTWEKDFPTLTLQHANLASTMKDMRSPDPGLEGGMLNIKGAKDNRGNTVGAKDGTNLHGTACFVYFDSYIKNKATGENIVRETVDKLPPEFFKAPADATHWNMSHERSIGSESNPIEIDIPPADYLYWLHGYDNSIQEDSKGMANKACFWLEVGTETKQGTRREQTGTRRGRLTCPTGPPHGDSCYEMIPVMGEVPVANTEPWAALKLFLKGKIEQRIEPTASYRSPPIERGDDTPPDTSTIGGSPGPTGGGMVDTTASDINEFGFSFDDTSLGGMDMPMDMDIAQEVNIDQSEVDQMTQDIFEHQTDNLEAYEEEVQTVTEAVEDIDANQTVDDNKEQNENTEQTTLDT